MKLAITSTDGVQVNEHFGMARKFYIYEYANGHVQFLEKRQTDEIYSEGDKTHPYEHARFLKALKMINDCKLIITKKIGEIPSGKLLEHGIEPVIFDGNINEVFQCIPNKLN